MKLAEYPRNAVKPVHKLFASELVVGTQLRKNPIDARLSRVSCLKKSGS